MKKAVLIVITLIALIYRSDTGFIWLAHFTGFILAVILEWLTPLTRKMAVALTLLLPIGIYSIVTGKAIKKYISLNTLFTQIGREEWLVFYTLDLH